MVRDLADSAVALVRREKVDEVQPRAREHAEAIIFANLALARGLGEPIPDAGTTAVFEAGLWRPERMEAYTEDHGAEREAERQRREEARHALRIDKARRELKYEPKVGIDEGLRKTGEWYERNGYLSDNPEPLAAKGK
jgi:nucleoside-diphosphate-sugar epimerase